ncbi:MAG: hypothetical protein GF329_02155 [Candidatus Lokiarchaeota archaeon]|nr:hypothetical protein [Candidatus Lokiarchaeota archaeon]
MYGEYVIMDNYLSFIVSILCIIMVACFTTAQIWKKWEKVLYIICGICTAVIIVNLVIYFAWPYV